MAKREDLPDWVIEALKANDRKGTVTDVAKYIWVNHESELKSSGNLFFTWQYDMRWAAQRLRDAGKLKYVREGRKSLWALR